MTTITSQDITALIPIAARALRGAVYRTPLERSAWLSALTGAEVYLKLECYQPTGSFKVRGAMAALTHHLDIARERGVLTASAGNHGLGVAFAAQRLGLDATIVLPESASPAKIDLLRRFPIRLLLRGADFDEAERESRIMERDTGALYVSAYNDPDVVAGGGTAGMEILEDLPGVDVVVVPAGGGGLIVGIGSWIEAVNSAIQVAGVQSEASPALERTLRAGRQMDSHVLPTLADGISGNIEQGSITVDLALEVVDDVALVTEEEIAAAIRDAYHELHLALEGSAVVGIAALLHGRLGDLSGKQVAILVTGRNIADERLMACL